MIKLDVTPDERKALAYTAGFILRVIEAPDQGAAGLGAVVRKVGARLAKQEFQQLALKLATAPQDTLRLETLTGYTIAIFAEAAQMDFEKHFLDWRAFRHLEPDLVITEFRPLAEIWQRCFGGMLENPHRVDLSPHQASWDSVRLRLLRGVGAEKRSLLRDALERQQALRAAMQPLMDAGLYARLEAIGYWRPAAIFTPESELTECPTCFSHLRSGSQVCTACAEIFAARLDPADAAKAWPALVMCGLLEGFLLEQELPWAGKCPNCLRGAGPPPPRGYMCLCGQLHTSLGELLPCDTAPGTLMMARSARVIYNLATGMPPLRTYGATDLTDDEQVKAAHARKWQEAQHALERLAKRAEELQALYKMAGLI